MTYDAWKSREPDNGQDDPRCTCRYETVHSASIDPPEMIVDPWCPVHGGRDPDYELEKARDDAEWEKQYGSHDWDPDYD